MSYVNDDTFDTTYRLVTAQDTGWYWEAGEHDNEDEVHAKAHQMFGGLYGDDYAVVEVSRRTIPGRNR